MSSITNSDNAMMSNQQARDLGHPLDPDAPTDAGAVDAKIERLPEGVDADGLIRGAHEQDESADTAAEREGALARAKQQPSR